MEREGFRGPDGEGAVTSPDGAAKGAGLAFHCSYCGSFDEIRQWRRVFRSLPSARPKDAHASVWRHRICSGLSYLLDTSER